MRFVKGQSGNPKGRPSYALPPLVHEQRKRNLVMVVDLVTACSALTDEQAIQRRARPETTQLESMIHAVIDRAKEGDVKCLQFVIEMIAGKMPEEKVDDLTPEDLEIVARVKEIKEQKQLK